GPEDVGGLAHVLTEECLVTKVEGVILSFGLRWIDLAIEAFGQIRQRALRRRASSCTAQRAAILEQAAELRRLPVARIKDRRMQMVDEPGCQVFHAAEVNEAY